MNCFSINDYKNSANFIKNNLGEIPKIAIVLGSGLGELVDKMSDVVSLKYEQIPNFPKSTASSHRGILYKGLLNDTAILVMAGRFHYYEGYSYEQIAYPIRVLKLLGIEKLVLTNAVGGVNFDYEVGDFVLINDHISMLANSPLAGEEISEFGNRFFDMTTAYDEDMNNIVRSVAQKNTINLHNGTYFYMTGPQFETKAEIRAIRLLGGDVVGMSTITEVMVAHQLGIRTIAISLVTNKAAGMTSSFVNSDEVEKNGQKFMKNFEKLISESLKQL